MCAAHVPYLPICRIGGACEAWPLDVSVDFHEPTELFEGKRTLTLLRECQDPSIGQRRRSSQAKGLSPTNADFQVLAGHEPG